MKEKNKENSVFIIHWKCINIKLLLNRKVMCPLHKPDNAGKTVQIKGILNQQTVADAHFSVEKKHQSRHNGDDTKTADLYQNQYNDLSEHAPSRSRGKSNKTCHAGGGGCREKRIEIRHGFSVCRADWQCQKSAPYENGHEEAEQYDLRG